MADPYMLFKWVSILLSLVLVVVEFATAGIAFFRLRASAAGLLVGGAHACFGVLVLLTMIVGHLLGQIIGYSAMQAVQGLLGGLDFLVTLLLAVGIVMIPLSLKKLSAKR